jgi:hypothetical protein
VGQKYSNEPSRSNVVGLDWIDLAQDKDSWQALVNAVMNLNVP